MQAADAFKWQAKLHRLVRDFFDRQDFLEVQSPTLVSNPGLEPHLDFFETTAQLEGGRQERLFLPSSPEYHLKKAMAWGDLPKVYEIAKAFRNGEVSPQHRPEFSMLEWYRAPGTLKEIQEDTIALCRRAALEFENQTLGLQLEKIERREYCDFFQELGIPLEEYLQIEVPQQSYQALRDKARGLGLLHSRSAENFEDLVTEIFVAHIEEKLSTMGALLIGRFPAFMRALSKLDPQRPYLCGRLELYIGGVELANAFDEDLSGQGMMASMKKDLALRRKLAKTEPPIDEQLLEACQSLSQRGPASGIALGLDRLLGCLVGQEDLGAVLAFGRPQWL